MTAGTGARLVRRRSLAGYAAWPTVAVLLGAPALVMGERLPREEARKLRSPIAYSQESVRAGRKLYLRLCQYCHGADGRAQANPDFEAPSLREPRAWLYGATDGELFVSIRDGAGHDMPPFGKQATSEQIWRLVHYIRSIGPPENRPPERAGGP